MPHTAAQKRENRRKKREAQDKLLKEQGAKLMKLAPPAKELKSPLSKDKVGTKADPGSHQLALNFPEDPQVVTEIQLGLGDDALQSQ